MKIALLSRSPELYSTRRLVEAAQQRGHDIRIVDILQCVLALRRGQPDLLCQGESLAGFDAVLPRIGASVTLQGLAVIRQFEAMGIPVLVPSTALGRSRDKLRCLQLLCAAGVGIPDSSYGFDMASHPAMIQAVGGVPLVLKLLEGAHGQGVVLTETATACDSVMGTLRAVQADFLAQTFVREADGCDLRCFVIGNEVVAAMRRQAAQGEFRSNLHRGGKASLETLSDEECHTAVQAAAVVGLPVAGVDILRSARGPVVMEVNSSPGLEGIETTAGLDIAGQVIMALERLAQRHLH